MICFITELVNSQESVGLNATYRVKAVFGHLSRALVPMLRVVTSGKIMKNLPQIGFPSL